MRKIILLLCLIFFTTSFASEWYEKNKKVLVVFPDYIKEYLKKSNYFDTKGKISYADYYLRLSLRKTEKVLPFSPSNWPVGWPKDREAMKYLKFATPEGYLYRIVGDYAFSHNRNKEAIKYYQMYISRCVIPDTDYMMKLANVFEKEGMLKNAEEIYKEVRDVIETKNFNGKKYSVAYLTRRIKEIEIAFKKLNILALNVDYNNIPDFIKSDFDNLFINTFKEKNTNVNLMTDKQLKKVLKEENMSEEDIEDEEDLSYVAKILNANYVIKPLLIRIDTQYIFEVNVFDPEKKIFFENYEFKTDNSRFLPNVIERFCYKFQGKDIPSLLYIPEHKLKWSFEADSIITDIKISKDGKVTIIGSENGSVYLLSNKGSLIKKLSLPDKIVKVAVSPDGNYFSFLCLNGKLYFVSRYGFVLWSKKLENYGRGVDISKDGRFLATGITNKVYYIDKKGEIFWDFKLPEWINIVKISPDAHNVFVGIENGDLFCFSDDGNIGWKKNLKSKIETIKISSDSKYISVSTEDGKIYIFQKNGNLIKNFSSDSDVNFATFSPSVLELLTGKKGKYLYFLSYDKKSLWKYQLKKEVDFAVGTADGSLIQTVGRRNLFTFSITWK